MKIRLDSASSTMIAVVVLVFWVVRSADAQKFEGLALTPPMGWNSWNHFGCHVDEALIRETAQAMVLSGLRDAGYRYVVIDDCWQVARDTVGEIVPDPDRFPSGMKALADYVHSLGLKFGLYSDAGRLTCQKRPGSRGYEFQDARTYARWGVDYLKYDWCNHGDQNVVASYRTMRDALYQAKRPVVFSICEWGENKPWEWAAEVGHLWRISGDIRPAFVDRPKWGETVAGIVEIARKIRKYAGPDHWNDLDMLQVGNAGLTLSESRTHFSMWAMLASPLMAGNDVRNMPPEIAEILMNREVIAVDQDSLGVPALRWISRGNLDVWLRPLAHDEYALCVVNWGKKAERITLKLAGSEIEDEDFGVTYKIGRGLAVRDLWKHRVIGLTDEEIAVAVIGHDVAMFRLGREK